MTQGCKIVEALLGDDDDPIADFFRRHKDDLGNEYKQIDGDWGDPWLYGGSWHNQHQSMIVHIEGLEGEGIADAEPWDMKLTPEETAAIMAQYPVLEDPEDPGAGDENERARDDAIDEIKTKKADAKNAAVKMPVYRFLDEDMDEDDWLDQAALAAQVGGGEGVWDDLPNAQKWIEAGRYYGFDELDSYPEEYTKAELSKYLGIEL